MANDHFIPRFLTKRWEVRDRRLLVFRFDERTFSLDSSRSLFAKEGLNSAEAEGLFNRVIETPVSQYLDAALREGPLARLLVPTHAEPARRALYALCISQAARIRDARSDESSFDDMLRRGLSLDDVIALTEQRSELVIIRTNPTTPLFFTEAAAFVVPVVGAAPAGLQPQGATSRLFLQAHGATRFAGTRGHPRGGRDRSFARSWGHLTRLFAGSWGQPSDGATA